MAEDFVGAHCDSLLVEIPGHEDCSCAGSFDVVESFEDLVACSRRRVVGAFVL